MQAGTQPFPGSKSFAPYGTLLQLQPFQGPTRLESFESPRDVFRAAEGLFIQADAFSQCQEKL